MSGKTWCLVDDQGRWTGRTFNGPAEWLDANTPAGCTALCGTPADLLQDGRMLPPAAPAATEWVAEWSWNHGALRHDAVPSVACVERAGRAERDARLAACDWTQLPDVSPRTRTAWQQYRQALRDVTGQPGWPHNTDWPAPPG
jgi:hypothetical protein